MTNGKYSIFIITRDNQPDIHLVLSPMFQLLIKIKCPWGKEKETRVTQMLFLKLRL